MANPSGNEKICIICGQDCSNAPRFKNEQGQYLHEACYQASQQPSAPPDAPAPSVQRAAASSPSLRTAASAPSGERTRPSFAGRPAPRQKRASSSGLMELMFSFDGRVGRLQYWMACFGIGFLNFLIAFIAEVTGLSFLGLLSLVTLWSMIAFNVKRWHDRDKSGYWIFIGLVPIIGWIWAVVEVGFLKGTVGSNQYGDDPVG